MKSLKFVTLAVGLFVSSASLSQAGLIDVLATGDPDTIKRYCLREARTDSPLKPNYSQLAGIYEGDTYLSFLGTETLNELTQSIIKGEEEKKMGRRASGATASADGDTLDPDYLAALTLDAEENGHSSSFSAQPTASDHELALSLQKDEERARAHRQGALSKATTGDLEMARALERALQQEDAQRSRSRAHAHPLHQTPETEKGAETQAKASMKALSSAVCPERLPFGMDVHGLDKSVGHYLPQTLDALVKMNIGQGGLSYENIAEEMSEFYRRIRLNMVVSSAPGAQATPLEKETLVSFIPRIFRPDFKGLGDPFRQMLSRAWTQARDDFETRGDVRGITHMGIAIAENYMGGGTDCIQGRRNRMLVAAMRIGGDKAVE